MTMFVEQIEFCFQLEVGPNGGKTNLTFKCYLV